MGAIWLLKLTMPTRLQNKNGCTMPLTAANNIRKVRLQMFGMHLQHHHGDSHRKDHHPLVLESCQDWNTPHSSLGRSHLVFPGAGPG